MKKLVELDGENGTVFVDPECVKEVHPSGLPGFSVVTVVTGTFATQHVIKGETRPVYRALFVTPENT